MYVTVCNKQFFVFRLNDVNKKKQRVYTKKKKLQALQVTLVKTIYIRSHAFSFWPAAAAKNHLAQQSNCVLR